MILQLVSRIGYSSGDEYSRCVSLRTRPGISFSLSSWEPAQVYVGPDEGYVQESIAKSKGGSQKHRR